MPNHSKRTSADRKLTRAARAIQEENPGMKYTEALREARRRALERADAAVVLDDGLDEDAEDAAEADASMDEPGEPVPWEQAKAEHGFTAAPDYPDPADVLAGLRQPPPRYGMVSPAAPAPGLPGSHPGKGGNSRRGTTS